MSQARPVPWEIEMSLMIGTLLVLALILLALLLRRCMDRSADRAEWARLTSLQPPQPATFEPAMVAHLPAPARRYFSFAIRRGAPLLPVVELQMQGQFSLGSQADPRYQTMQARQILAPPEGFIWAMRTRSGMALSGSDSGQWTRFRVFGLIPVARLGGEANHSRSAFGRCVGEATFWTPAALLPGPGVSWEAVDANTARVTIRHGEMEQAVDVTVDAEGRPVQVSFQRWSNANPEQAYRLQPFGGYLSDFREVEGYCLPFRVEAGNLFGTEAYFPFYLAEVTSIRFPTPCP